MYLSAAELEDIVQQLRNKQFEILSPNLNGCKERKLELFTDLFQTYLSFKGMLLLKTEAYHNLRNAVINKINEIAIDPFAQQHAAYMASARNLKMYVENVNRGIIANQEGKDEDRREVMQL